MATITIKDGGIDPELTYLGTSNLKEEVEPPTLPPSSFSTSHSPGDEEKAHSTSSAQFQDEIQHPTDREELHLPVNVERWYLASFFWIMIVCGWSDGTTGPLVPRMQEHFDVGYTIISLVFVCVCIGYFIAAALNVWLEDRFGFGKALLIGTAFQLTAYVLLATPTPYPVFCIGFVFSGIGAGTVQCLATAFLMKLHRNQNLKQCLCQAC